MKSINRFNKLEFSRTLININRRHWLIGEKHRVHALNPYNLITTELVINYAFLFVCFCCFCLFVCLFSIVWSTLFSRNQYYLFHGLSVCTLPIIFIQHYLDIFTKLQILWTELFSLLLNCTIAFCFNYMYSMALLICLFSALDDSMHISQRAWIYAQRSYNPISAWYILIQ